MKFNLSGSELHEILQSASRLASSNIKGNQLSASNVLMEIEGGKLSVTATDMETRLIQTIALEEVEDDGRYCFTVSPAIILNPIGELGGQNLRLDFDPEEYLLEVTYSNGNFQIPVSGADNFPGAAQLGDHTYTMDMTVDALYSGLYNTLFTTSVKDNTVTAGVHIEATPEYISFVATNFFTLGIYKNYAFTYTPQPNADGSLVADPVLGGFTVPKKSARLLMSLLEKKKDLPLLVEVSDNLAVFTCEGLHLQCRLLGAKYPNYSSVIPKGNDKELVVDRVMFSNAVKRVSIFSDEAKPYVSIDITSKELRFYTRMVDYSISAEERIPASFTSDEVISFEFNPILWRDALGNLKSQEIIFKIGDHTRPIIMIPSEHAEEEEITIILVPFLKKQ